MWKKNEWPDAYEVEALKNRIYELAETIIYTRHDQTAVSELIFLATEAVDELYREYWS